MYLDFGSLIAILFLFAMLFAAWFWNDSLRARDQVIAMCFRMCGEINVQFLDETVALSGLHVRRGPSGRPEFVRHYAFEYSRTGADRWPGDALLAGRNLESVRLHGPEGTTILGTAVPPGSSLPSSPETGPRDWRH
ncbi:MAG TPA: DUF3301 domain-containing protein [Gammaproteobacteria bacterium]|nr:DUF3301 domain-containing protein [Gammaproteobacteria bacterium]